MSHYTRIICLKVLREIICIFDHKGIPRCIFEHPKSMNDVF